jgi:hypothetical protein
VHGEKFRGMNRAMNSEWAENRIRQPTRAIMKNESLYLNFLLKIENRSDFAIKSLKRLDLFTSGYSNAIIDLTFGCSRAGHLWSDFVNHSYRKYGVVGSVFTTFEAAAYDEESSWNLFYRELKEFLTRRSIEIVPQHVEIEELSWERHQEMLTALFDRPSMFLGTASLTYFKVYLDGYLEGESSHAKVKSIFDEWIRFENWMLRTRKNGWKCRWDRSLLLAAGYDEAKAFETFTDVYAKWLKSGESSH